MDELSTNIVVLLFLVMGSVIALMLTIAIMIYGFSKLFKDINIDKDSRLEFWKWQKENDDPL